LATGALVDLVRIQHDINRGEDVQRSVRATDLAKPNGLARPADTALRPVRRAEHRARTSLALAVLRPVPLLGHQVKALRSMTGTAAEVAAIGDAAARAVQQRLDAAKDGPPGRIALLETADNEVARARVKLSRITVANDRWVLPPLRGARGGLQNSLASARTKLRDISTMVKSLRRMFIGPTNLLLLAGNNAEMRSGGMPLSAGIVELENGAIKVRRFVPTGKLFVKRGPVPVPRELRDLYGALAIGSEWRGTTVTPNFPAIGPVYSQMARSVGFGEVQAVMFVDVLALRAVISAIGPVDLDGVKYDAKNIEQEVMNENYIRFPVPDSDVQAERYDVQSRLGVAIFDALNTRPLKLGSLVSNLSAAGKGRHLLAWSQDPGLTMVWQRAGIDGALPQTSLMVAMENISANKLDWYITPRVGLRTLKTTRKARRVELSVTFTNTPRTRTSDVVEGILYDRTHGMQDGEHRVLLLAYLPNTAVDIASADPPFSVAGTDGGLKVVGFRYGVELGKTRTVKITFSIPKGQVFTIIPSARAHPVPYVTSKATYKDGVPVSFRL
jgi:hypothetical protein